MGSWIFLAGELWGFWVSGSLRTYLCRPSLSTTLTPFSVFRSPSINMQMNQSGMEIHAKNLISPYHPLIRTQMGIF